MPEPGKSKVFFAMPSNGARRRDKERGPNGSPTKQRSTVIPEYLPQAGGIRPGKEKEYSNENMDDTCNHQGTVYQNLDVGTKAATHNGLCQDPNGVTKTPPKGAASETTIETVYTSSENTLMH
ncbi:hypothetical protein JOM56_013126 [Amanita muscaria]